MRTGAKVCVCVVCVCVAGRCYVMPDSPDHTGLPLAAVTLSAAAGATLAAATLAPAPVPTLPTLLHTGSNTGCLLAASLTGAELLLRGHAPHDERLAKLLADGNSTPVLLWPDENALTPEELRQLADAQSGGHVTLVALDASWDGARRMRSHFPPGVRTLRLPPGLALPGAAEDEHVGSSAGGGGSGSAAGRGSMAHGLHGGGGDNQQQLPMLTDEAGVRVSLLRPLRKYPHAHKTGRVSTLEAVAAALLALEDDGANTVLYAGLLRNLTLKVDAARRQKHMPEIFHTMNDSN